MQPKRTAGLKDDSSSEEEYKGCITEEMISDKIRSFISEGSGSRHMYKLHLLETHYSNWLKKHSHLSSQKRNYIMCKKKKDKKKLLTPLRQSRFHIRWLKCISKGELTFVKNSAVLLGAGYYIFIYDIIQKSWKMYSCCQFETVDGISCLQGSRNEDLFALSEKCQQSRIFLITYPELQTVYKLKDRYGGKVIGLSFGDNETLIVLKCSMTEHRIVIWSWRSSQIIFSYICDKPHLHPDIFRSSLDHPSCAMLSYDRSQQFLQFWKINFCGEDSVFITRRSSKVALDLEFHDMVYSPEGVLFLIDSNGNIHSYEYTPGKFNLLIRWKDKTPIGNVKESKYSIMNLIKPTKEDLRESRVGSPTFVYEDEPEVIPEPSELNVPIHEYVEYESDEYCDDDDTEEKFQTDHEDSLSKSKEKKCHMVWYKTGLIASGPDAVIKYFLKSPEGDDWTKIWGLVPFQPITQFVVNQKYDCIMGWSEQYGLMKINLKANRNKITHFFGGKVREMCFLRPLDSFLLTIGQQPELCVWKKRTGQLVNCIQLPSEMDCIIPHYNSPLVILKSVKEGSLYGVDLTKPRNANVWPALKVIREPFSSLSFLYKTDFIVASSKNRKRIYFFKAKINTGFEVINYFDLRHSMLDFIIVTSDDGLNRGLALLNAVPEGEACAPKGYKAGKLFDVVRFPSMNIDKTWCSDHFYKSIKTGPGLSHILAIPADTKWEIHSYSIDFKKAGSWKFLSRMHVIHQVGPFSVSIFDQHLVTYGFDGMVTCYNTVNLLNDEKPFCVLVPHHRFDGGIQQAIMDYKGSCIITRGQDGLIICSRIRSRYQCKDELHVPQKEPKIGVQETQLRHVIEYGNELWEESRKKQQLETEALLAAPRIQRIKSELEDIRKLWEECYIENSNEVEANKIPEIEFQLDKQKIDRLVASTDNDIAEVTTYLSNELDITNNWIKRWKEACWDMMPVKLYKLKPFTARFFLQNFNQSAKPLQYEQYHLLLDVVSKLDSAVFPIPQPKMLPWGQLDNDEEYPEFKIQKYPEEPKLLEDVEDEFEELEDIEVKEDEIAYLEEEEEEEHEALKDASDHEEKGEEEEEYEGDEGEDDDDDSGVVKIRLPPPPEIIEVEVCQEQSGDLMSPADKCMTRDKIIFQEVEKLRQFYEDKILKKKSALDKEETDKQFEEWKKQYIEKHDLNNVEDSDYEISVVSGSSEDVMQQYYEANQPKKPVVENKEGSEDEILEETDGLIYEATNEEKQNAAPKKQNLDEAEEEQSEEENIDFLEGGYNEQGEHLSTSEERPAGNGDSDTSSFSWSEVELDVEVAKAEVAMKELAEQEEMKRIQAQKKELEVPVWGDLDDKRVIAAEEAPEDPLDEPYSLFGAQTLRFANVDYSRCNEFSLNGLFMADIQVSKLQNAIEELESSFNKYFEIAQKRKGDDMAVIKSKNATLIKHIEDLVNICKGTSPVGTPVDFEWSTSEMPDWIWEEPDIEGITGFKEVGKGKEAALEESKNQSGPEKKEVIEEKKEEISQDPFKKICLHQMMGGVMEVTWQEQVQGDIKIPKFVLEKDPDEITPEDIREMEKYFTALDERQKKLQHHKEVAENEIKKLHSETKYIIRSHDTDFVDIMRRRMITEGCIYCELLKIARLKHRRLIADRTIENIGQMKDMLNDFHTEGMRRSAMSREFLRKTAFLYNEIDKHQAKQKSIEVDFLNKLEPLKLTKKIMDTFRVLIKKKPTFETDKKVYPTELLTIARSLLKCEYPPYCSEATISFYRSLEKLDNTKNIPHNVEYTVWDMLTHHRQLKIVSDLISKAMQMLAGEAEKTATLYYKYFVSHLERYDRLKCNIRDQKIRLEDHCNKIEFQLILPEGFVETHQTGNIEDFKDCIYVSKKYIDNLNKEVIELQKMKEATWADFDKYMCIVNNAELLHKELRLRIKIKENILRDIKTAKINKYTKEFISEYKRRNKPNYEVKLHDTKRQEKLKEMVKKYFKSYYTTIKEIQKAGKAQVEWEDETRAVVANNERLAAENQELSSLIKSTATGEAQKHLQEKNEAIMLHGKLMRECDANTQEIEALRNELQRLILRTHHTLIEE